MKVLIINTMWTGSSTGKIAYGFYKELSKRGHQCKMVYGNSFKECNDENVIKIAPRLERSLHYRVNMLTGYHGRFAPIAFKRLKRVIKQFRPDIVQLYNLHGYYMDIYKLFYYLKTNCIPTVYSMLDEYPYMGYCCYPYDCEQFKTGCNNCQMDMSGAYLKSLFFNRAQKTLHLKECAYNEFEKLVFVGPQWVVERAKESYLLKDKKLYVVDEFVDTKDTFLIMDSADLRQKIGISDDKIIVLNVAPLSDSRKGVKYFIELAKSFRDMRYMFINIGYDGDRNDLPSNFIAVPYISDQKLLAKYYSMADLFVCTSMADTMPNVCLDSLACGTPICGFDITGIPYVAEEPLGRFVTPGSLVELSNILLNTNKKNSKIEQECRKYAVNRYSVETYTDKMLDIYQRL